MFPVSSEIRSGGRKDINLQSLDLTVISFNTLSVNVVQWLKLMVVIETEAIEKAPVSAFIVSQLDKCLKFKSIQGDENNCALFRKKTRNAFSFRHLSRCGIIVDILTF